MLIRVAIFIGFRLLYIHRQIAHEYLIKEIFIYRVLERFIANLKADEMMNY